MISNTQNHLLNQMQALEAMARSQQQQPEIKTDQGQNFAELMQQFDEQFDQETLALRYNHIINKNQA